MLASLFGEKSEAMKKLDIELKLLNDNVDNTIKQRKKWMDEHMENYATYKVGEMLYNLDNGQPLGRVSKYYRYHQGDSRFDDSMSLDYQYEDYPNCFDNTSRNYLISIGNKQDLINRTKRQLIILETEKAAAGGDK